MPRTAISPLGGRVPPAPGAADGDCPGEPGDQAQGPGGLYRREPVPLHEVLPPEGQGAVRRVLEESFLHHRPRGDERGLPEPARAGSRQPRGPAVHEGGSRLHAGAGSLPRETGNNYNLDHRRRHCYRLAQIDKEKSRILCANEPRLREARAEPFYELGQLPVNFRRHLRGPDLQDGSRRSTRGTVFHTFAGSASTIRRPSRPWSARSARATTCPTDLYADLQRVPLHGYLKGAGGLPGLPDALRDLFPRGGVPAADRAVEPGEAVGVPTAQGVPVLNGGGRGRWRP